MHGLTCEKAAARPHSLMLNGGPRCCNILSKIADGSTRPLHEAM